MPLSHKVHEFCNSVNSHETGATKRLTMFQTLKAQNGALGDSEYVVRSSIPASDKAKATRKQPACTRCKMKKVRTSLLSEHDNVHDTD